MVLTSDIPYGIMYTVEGQESTDNRHGDGQQKGGETFMKLTGKAVATSYSFRVENDEREFVSTEEAHEILNKDEDE